MAATGARTFARDTVGREVRRVLRSHLSLRWREQELADQIPLGGTGLGLDSIKLLDVILACEQSFDVHMPVEELSVSAPTLGDLVALVEAALERAAE